MISRGATIKKLKLTKFVSLHSKPIREDNKIFEAQVPSTIKCTPKVQQRNEENHTQKGLKWGGRVLPRELLNDRQGKCNDDSEKDCESRSDMEISAESTTEAALQATATDEFDLGKGHVLLRPPITHSTGKIATGATTHLLRKQHKIAPHRNVTGTANQRPMEKTPRGNNPTRRTTEEQTKNIGGKGMAPQGLAPTHEAAELLNDWENLGCPTKTG